LSAITPVKSTLYQEQRCQLSTLVEEMKNKLLKHKINLVSI